MLSLSSRQYAMLKRLPEEFTIELAKKYNQTTFGSFGRKSRGYVKKHGTKFKLTGAGVQARQEFGKEEIYRKVITDQLSVHFRSFVVSIKRSA